MRKPEWLQKKIDIKKVNHLKQRLSQYHYHTICEEALCPNISECFEKGVATFLIMGDLCTRKCKFCNVQKGDPAPLDNKEPESIAYIIKDLKLKYVVITSVTRDDLADQGSNHFVKTIIQIKKTNPDTLIEVLIPDFNADKKLLVPIIETHPAVIAHNVETVRAMYPGINRPLIRYQTSLNTLKALKQISPAITTKSGIMLGLGEKESEVYQTMKDLRNAGCDLLSIGQYLAPSISHFPVKEYIHPDQFEKYKNSALAMGFKNVKSKPYVRSSYLADEYL